MFAKKFISTNSGFTLIELLVVIAIISLLSTVTLAALNNARTKAQNTAVAATVREYVTAFQDYYDDNGDYPTIPSSEWACLGNAKNGQCILYVTRYTDSTLNNKLSKYYPGMPFYDDVTSISVSEGPMYVCYLDPSNSNTCEDSYLYYSFKGISKCPIGITADYRNSDLACMYIFK